MKRMLDDYQLDEHLHYEAHMLLYTLPKGEQVVITGMRSCMNDGSGFCKAKRMPC